MDPSNSELFKSINNDNDDNISLAGSVISAYDNMNNNIDDLISVLKNGGSSQSNRRRSKSCILQTVNETVTPDDSISQINANYNLNNDDDDINNHINMFSAALQQQKNNTPELLSLPNNISLKPYSKSIFESPSPSSNIIKHENIFDINKNKVQQELNTSNVNDEQYTGGKAFISNIKKNENFHTIVLIILSGVFCVLSFYKSNNYYLNTIVYIIMFCIMAYVAYDSRKIKSSLF